MNKSSFHIYAKRHLDVAVDRLVEWSAWFHVKKIADCRWEIETEERHMKRLRLVEAGGWVGPKPKPSPRRQCADRDTILAIGETSIKVMTELLISWAVQFIVTPAPAGHWRVEMDRDVADRMMEQLINKVGG